MTEMIEIEDNMPDEHNILGVTNWRNYSRNIIDEYNLSQFDYYKQNTMDEDILTMVSLESKRFGSVSEKILCHIFNIGPRTSTQNDGTRNGKKLEIKAARRWAGKNDCKWQHLELEHDYEYVLFALLDFDGWKVWCINKTVLMGVCRDNNIVTEQGKQGWWCKKSEIQPYLTEIHNTSDLDNFLDTN